MAFTAIIVLVLTVLGLSAVNVYSDLASVISEGHSTLPYWLPTGAIPFYVVMLSVL
ncbi:MAG: hypothetical protein AAF387_19200 [Pseudomonadota bacterium]